MNTRLSPIALAIALAAGTLASTACTVQTTADPARMGQLTLAWTIDESTDASLCAQSSAASFHVHVVDEVTGNAVGDFSFDCTAGTATLNLDQGSYEAQAWLEDSSGTSRTTMDSVPAFTINSTPISFTLDFASTSFE